MKKFPDVLRWFQTQFRTSAQCAFWVVRWPCSQNGPVSNTIRRRGGYKAIFREEGVDTGPYLGEITDLEFGTHGFLKNHVFLPTEHAGTNIC